MNNAAAEVLGRLGKKLNTHEVHVRRAHNGGIIAKHIMRDENGNEPVDAQRREREYTIKNLSDLAAHFAEHMPDKKDVTEPGEDTGESSEAAAQERGTVQ